MELNRDEIIKALECCILNHSCTGCPLTSSEDCLQIAARKAIALIKELTEENERLRADQSKIKRKVLMEAASKFAGHSDYHGDTILCKLICMSEGKEVRVATPIDEVRRKETRADTVKKMHSEIKERCIKGGIYPAFVASTIDQIAKEMLKEDKNND